MRYSIEKRVRVYSDDHGYYWEARPDADGLGIEIVYNEGDGKSKDQPLSSIPADVVPLLDALQPIAAPAPAAPAGVTVTDAMVEAAARTWFDLSVMSQANGWCAGPESARVVYLDRMRAALAAALAAAGKG